MFALPYPVAAFLSEYRDYVLPLTALGLIRWVGARSIAVSAVSFLISAVVVFVAYMALCRTLLIVREAETSAYVIDTFGPVYLTSAAVIGAVAFFFRPHSDRPRFLAALVTSSILVAVAVPLSQMLGGLLRFGYGNVAHVVDTPAADWLRYGAVGFATALLALVIPPAPDDATPRLSSSRT